MHSRNRNMSGVLGGLGWKRSLQHNRLCQFCNFFRNEQTWQTRQYSESRGCSDSIAPSYLIQYKLRNHQTEISPTCSPPQLSQPLMG